MIVTTHDADSALKVMIFIVRNFCMLYYTTLYMNLDRYVDIYLVYLSRIREKALVNNYYSKHLQISGWKAVARCSRNTKMYVYVAMFTRV